MITKFSRVSTIERSHLVRYRARAARLGCAAAILLAGNQGSTVQKFSSYQPTATGDILWMVVITDDDPDLDEALGVTHVTER